MITSRRERKEKYLLSFSQSFSSFYFIFFLSRKNKNSKRFISLCSVLFTSFYVWSSTTFCFISFFFSITPKKIRKKKAENFYSSIQLIFTFAFFISCFFFHLTSILHRCRKFFDCFFIDAKQFKRKKEENKSNERFREAPD